MADLADDHPMAPHINALKDYLSLRQSEAENREAADRVSAAQTQRDNEAKLSGSAVKDVRKVAK